MRKIILIIIIMISSFSYYGVVDDNSEESTEIQNVIDYDNEIISEDSIVEEQDVSEEEQKTEKAIQDTTENTSIIQNSNDISQVTENKTVNETQDTTENITTNVENKKTGKNETSSSSTSQIETEEIEEIKVEIATKTECTGNNHLIESGNTGKWFDTKDEAVAYYKAEIKKWGELWTSFEIDDDEYYSNCPRGYEVWTCPQCQKWTINFYYR